VRELGVRALRAEDAPVFEALVARARGAGELAASSDPDGHFFARYVLRNPDQAAVAESDGVVVGWIVPDVKVVVVEPAYRRRGIGTALVEAGTAIEGRRGRDNLIIGVLPDDAAGRAFLEAAGFAFHSTLWDLRLPPDTAIAAPSWPSGVTVRTIDGSSDLPAFVELFNAAFATHATPIQMDLESVTRDREGAEIHDEDIVLVERDGRLLGFAASEPRRLAEGGVQPDAEIWTIGVHPDEQGRGLGRQLLRAGVAYLRGLGVVTVHLSVNGRNPAALGLYESEGFERVATRDRWARPVHRAS
jgi:mycothiol synthase